MKLLLVILSYYSYDCFPFLYSFLCTFLNVIIKAFSEFKKITINFIATIFEKYFKHVKKKPQNQGCRSGSVLWKRSKLKSLWNYLRSFMVKNMWIVLVFCIKCTVSLYQTKIYTYFIFMYQQAPTTSNSIWYFGYFYLSSLSLSEFRIACLSVQEGGDRINFSRKLPHRLQIGTFLTSPVK